MAKEFSYTVKPDQANRRLDQVLFELMQAHHWSKSSIRKSIVSGAVYLNGKRIRIASKPVFAKAHLRVYASSSKKTFPEFHPTEKDVLFEDDWLLLINKPAEIPTQPTLDDARSNVFYALKKWKKTYLGLHHRLDKDTSGVLLFTKSKDINREVSNLFQNREIEKHYLALCDAQEKMSAQDQISKEETLSNFLGPIPGKNRPKKYGILKKGGQPAITHLKIIRRFENRFLIEAKPETGRTHQIRVHLASRGLPIIGDSLYHPSPKKGGCLLHAAQLKFRHPKTKKWLLVSAPLPRHFLRAEPRLKSLQKEWKRL